MNTAPRKNRASRVLVPLALAGAIGAALISPTTAMAAGAVDGSATGAYASAGVGYNNVIDAHAAGSVILKIEGGDSVEAFCLAFAKDLATTGTYTATTHAKSGITNVGAAADLATMHKSIGTVLTDPRAENTATQLAIWSLTDAKSFKAVPNAEIVARATVLAAAHPETFAATEGLSGLALEASVKTVGALSGPLTPKETLTVTATSDGSPVHVSVPVSAVVNGTTFTSTTVNGVAAIDIPASTKGGTITVTATSIVAAGTVMVPAGKQPMVTASQAKITRVTTAVLPAYTIVSVPKTVPTPPAPVVTPVPVVPVATPVPVVPAAAPVVAPKPVIISTTPAAKTLPFTGGWAQPWMLVLAGAVTAGGVTARRRTRTGR